MEFREAFYDTFGDLIERDRKNERERSVLEMLRDSLPLNNIIRYSKLSRERILELAQSNGLTVVT